MGIEGGDLLGGQVPTIGHRGHARLDDGLDVQRSDRGRPIDDAPFELVPDPHPDHQPGHQQDGEVGHEEALRQ